MDNKICNKCKQEKEIEMFSKSIRTKTGYKNSCKECDAEYAREFRKKNPGYKGSGKNKKYKDNQKIVSHLRRKVSNANARAKKGDYDFNISFEYAYEIWKNQNGLCALSGIPLSIEIGDNHVASLDKIDPNKGYIEGNIQWLSWSVNRAKGDLTTLEFINMCKKVIGTCNDYRKDT